jgi:hypothetical protein
VGTPSVGVDRAAGARASVPSSTPTTTTARIVTLRSIVRSPWFGTSFVPGKTEVRPATHRVDQGPDHHGSVGSTDPEDPTLDDGDCSGKVGELVVVEELIDSVEDGCSGSVGWT